MRKMLLIPFAAACAVIASCAQVKAPASAEALSPAAKTSSSEKKDVSSESSAPSPVASSGINSGTNPGAASSVSGVTLPSLQDMGDGLDDIPVPLGPLPGDLRGNLRTPDMPSTLPMSVDGKINPSGF